MTQEWLQDLRGVCEQLRQLSVQMTSLTQRLEDMAQRAQTTGAANPAMTSVPVSHASPVAPAYSAHPHPYGARYLETPGPAPTRSPGLDAALQAVPVTRSSHVPTTVSASPIGTPPVWRQSEHPPYGRQM